MDLTKNPAEWITLVFTLIGSAITCVVYIHARIDALRREHEKKLLTVFDRMEAARKEREAAIDAIENKFDMLMSKDRHTLRGDLQKVLADCRVVVGEVKAEQRHLDDQFDAFKVNTMTKIEVMTLVEAGTKPVAALLQEVHELDKTLAMLMVRLPPQTAAE